MDTKTEKPLFIPLKREHFEAFDKGLKKEEYRPAGPRWNARVCRIGRRVVVSLGYSTPFRMGGVITSYKESYHQPKAYQKIYGARGEHLVSAIGIELDGVVLKRNRNCSDCGDRHPKGSRFFHCSRCQKLVCGHCWTHTHLPSIMQKIEEDKKALAT